MTTLPATRPATRKAKRSAVRPTTLVRLNSQASLNFGGVPPGSSGPDITPPLGGGLRASASMAA